MSLNQQYNTVVVVGGGGKVKHSHLESKPVELSLAFTHLYHFHIWQTVQEGLQIDAIEHDAVVEYVSIRLEINHCLFLGAKERKTSIRCLPLGRAKTNGRRARMGQTLRCGNMLAWSPMKKVLGM